MVAVGWFVVGWDRWFVVAFGWFVVGWDRWFEVAVGWFAVCLRLGVRLRFGSLVCR